MGNHTPDPTAQPTIAELEQHLSHYAGSLFTGEVIRLRPATPGDFPTLATWLNDPVQRILHEDDLTLNPVDSVASWLHQVHSNEHKHTLAYCITTHEGELVGHTFLRRVHAAARVATLELLIGAPHTQLGYGTDAMTRMVHLAFAEHGLNKIEVSCWEYNQRAIQLLDRHGFSLEGRRRDVVYHDGSYSAVLQFGLLSSEYYATRARGEALPAVQLFNSVTNALPVTPIMPPARPAVTMTAGSAPSLGKSPGEAPAARTGFDSSESAGRGASRPGSVEPAGGPSADLDPDVPAIDTEAADAADSAAESDGASKATPNDSLTATAEAHLAAAALLPKAPNQQTAAASRSASPSQAGRPIPAEDKPPAARPDSAPERSDHQVQQMSTPPSASPPSARSTASPATRPGQPTRPGSVAARLAQQPLNGAAGARGVAELTDRMNALHDERTALITTGPGAGSRTAHLESLRRIGDELAAVRHELRAAQASELHRVHATPSGSHAAVPAVAYPPASDLPAYIDPDTGEFVHSGSADQQSAPEMVLPEPAPQFEDDDDESAEQQADHQTVVDVTDDAVAEAQPAPKPSKPSVVVRGLYQAAMMYSERPVVKSD